ncbi:unnamed protein product [Brassica oleracea]
MIPYSVSLSRQSRLPLSYDKKATQRRFRLFPPPRQRRPATIESPPSLSHDKKATQR